MMVMALTGLLAACGGGGGGTTAAAPAAVVGTEVWGGSSNNGQGDFNYTLSKDANGTVTASGTWNMFYGGYHVSCPFTTGPIVFAGNSISFTGSGTATTPDAPVGYQTSNFTVTANGTVGGGEGTGIYTMTFTSGTHGWPASDSGNWVAQRASGSGITPEGNAGNNTGNQENQTAPLAPPSWIQGTWTGGSPISLSLTFTGNNILNSSSSEEFAGFVETEKTDTRYHLVKSSTGEESVFTKLSAAQVSWWTTNGSLSNTVTMTRN